MDETPERGRLYHYIKLSNHGTHDRPNARRYVGPSHLRRTRLVRRILYLRENCEIVNHWKSTKAPYSWMYAYKLDTGEFATVEQSEDRQTWFLNVYTSQKSYESLEDPTDYWPFDLKRSALHFLKFNWDANEPTFYVRYD